MDLNTLVNYCFWTPILLWVGLYFWFRNVSYIVLLKKKMDRGERWAYVFDAYVKHPERVFFLHWADVLFSVVVSVATAAVVVGLLAKFGFADNAYYGFLTVFVFLFLAYTMKRRVEIELTDLFQSAFYWVYRWVRYEIESKGVVMSEENVRDRAGLSFAHKLRNAENHNLFWMYVKAMAKSQKVPPELFGVY